MIRNRGSPAVRFWLVRGGGAFRPWLQTNVSNSPETGLGPSSSEGSGLMKRASGAEQTVLMTAIFPEFAALRIREIRAGIDAYLPAIVAAYCLLITDLLKSIDK